MELATILPPCVLDLPSLPLTLPILLTSASLLARQSHYSLRVVSLTIRLGTVTCVPQKGMGAVTESRKPNGFFTSIRDGARRHEQVSAVLFYRFKWLEDDHVHQIHIYHNPFAQRTVNTDLFPGIPQMVPYDDETMRWINGEPEPY